MSNMGTAASDVAAAGKDSVSQAAWLEERLINPADRISLKKLSHMCYQHPNLDEITQFLIGTSIYWQTLLPCSPQSLLQTLAWKWSSQRGLRFGIEVTARKTMCTTPSRGRDAFLEVRLKWIQDKTWKGIFPLHRSIDSGSTDSCRSAELRVCPMLVQSRSSKMRPGAGPW